MKDIVAVIGAGECDQDVYQMAFEIGRLLAENKYPIICGGLGGVMEAVSKGAKLKNGLTIGILPGNETKESNSYIDIPIATGMGIGRNIIIVRTAAIVLAINGKYGTLSEIAFALQLGKPVIGLNTWNVSDQIVNAKSVKEAFLKMEQILKNV